MVIKGAIKTTWRQGGVEKVGWGILANHGGGYSYRLCRVGEQLTEECFQKTPLRSHLVIMNIMNVIGFSILAY